MSIEELHYTAIDFETANGNAGSACAVALIRVESGRVVDRFSSLLRPVDGGGFSSFNTRIHGLRARDVADAPTWQELWPTVRTFVGRDALVAHNAPFDRGVWRAAGRLAGIGEAEPDFYCTVRLARRHLSLPSNRLPLVVEALGLPNFRHHDAEADALACAQIGIEISRRAGLSRVEDFGAPVGAGRR
ncbi:3'-5' exonuclease [Scrofimicrobium sp. R131]|uniref:3'-5' exonuclease n=1 Tax=Scrofimicrobium appendicitidis TaxID=3079930 RepID=A0AAU7V869_9ACTO